MKYKTGLINEVWKEKCGPQYRVVKRINPKSPHARSISDYKKIEKLKKLFIENKVPLILADEIKDHQISFPFVEGEVLYSAIGPTSDEHAFAAGQLLGEIHALNIREFDQNLRFDFSTPQSELCELIKKIKKIDLHVLIDINEKCLSSMSRLSENLLFSHCDFYPHNILWSENCHYLIDWEFAGLINPGLEFVLASMCFSEENFKAGYISGGGRFEDNEEDCFWGAINNGWVYWIVYNMKVAVDERVDIEKRKQAHENVVEYYQHLLSLIYSPSPELTPFVRPLPQGER